MNTSAQLIGVDWGSSSLRIFLLGAAGEVLATHAAQYGASTMQRPEDFATTLQNCAASWLQLQNGTIPVVACGMVGSKHGWEEVPYQTTPAGPADLARNLRRIEGTHVSLVPGLIHRPKDLPPDVMRGEETQVVGALNTINTLSVNACIVMPGTHAKWTMVRQHQIVEFATHMTGELFSVLKLHSVLGRLLSTEPGESDEAAFLMALDAVRLDPQAGLTQQLFAVRTLGLTGALSAQGLEDYMSGLLIGHEIQAGLQWIKKCGSGAIPLLLVGEPELCERYRKALQRFDVSVEAVLPNTAPAGLWAIAHSAELV